MIYTTTSGYRFILSILAQENKELSGKGVIFGRYVDNSIVVPVPKKWDKENKGVIKVKAKCSGEPPAEGVLCAFYVEHEYKGKDQYIVEIKGFAEIPERLGEKIMKVSELFLSNESLLVSPSRENYGDY